MGVRYSMYTKTDNVLCVEYKDLMHLVVKLSDVDDITHTCDLLVIAPVTRVLIGVDIREFKCILNLQRRTCVDIFSYICSIKRVLKENGRTKVVIDNILKSLTKDNNFKYIKEYLTVLCLTKEYGKNSVDMSVKYNTILRLPTNILSSYINRVTKKGLNDMLSNAVGFLYKYTDLKEVFGKYDFYIAGLSLKGTITKNRLHGCYIGEKSSNIGYHFSNISYNTVEDIYYGTSNDERKYIRITNNNKELIGYEDLVCGHDTSVLDDIYGNIGNIVILTDLIYAINRYELGKNLSFRECYILAIMGLKCELDINKKYNKEI